jgi:hypothetical protein
MFKFLKRLVRRPPPPRRSPSATANLWKRMTGPSPFEPPPVGEVQVRGDSAWDDWEHSQIELDSRMGGLSAFDSIRVRDGTSQVADLDPFEAVRKRK